MSEQNAKAEGAIKLYLLLAHDPVVSLSLCDRLKPVLGSGWPLLLRPRDGAQGLPEVDWFGSEDLSDSEVDDTDRLPREEDLDEEDELPMAAEVVRWVEEGLGGNAAPTDDNDDEEEEEEGWADRNLAGAAMAEVTELGLVLGLVSGFSRETDSLLWIRNISISFQWTKFCTNCANLTLEKCCKMYST